MHNKDMAFIDSIFENKNNKNILITITGIGTFLILAFILIRLYPRNSEIPLTILAALSFTAFWRFSNQRELKQHKLINNRFKKALQYCSVEAKDFNTKELEVDSNLNIKFAQILNRAQVVEVEKFTKQELKQCSSRKLCFDSLEKKGVIIKVNDEFSQEFIEELDELSREFNLSTQFFENEVLISLEEYLETPEDLINFQSRENSYRTLRLLKLISLL